MDMNRRRILAYQVAIVAAWIAAAGIGHAQGGSPLPQDIVEFVARRAHCLIWSMDPTGYRAIQTEDFIQSQRCDQIAKDEVALRGKYAGDSDALQMIESRSLVVGWRRQPAPTSAPADAK
ncbi:MAG: hypothetical protein ACRC1G_03045 [Bradyrhizobium sp.]|nr:hypothetical protein [Bradyrhizobium sp.]